MISIYLLIFIYFLIIVILKGNLLNNGLCNNGRDEYDDDDGADDTDDANDADDAGDTNDTDDADDADDDDSLNNSLFKIQLLSDIDV